MSSSNIRVRRVRTGRRYDVRYRPGGRDSAWVHVKTFKALGEARACKKWVDGELAIGRRPDLRAELTREPRSVAAVAEEFRSTLVDVGPSVHKTHRQAVARLGALGGMDPGTVRHQDVQLWIAAQDDLRPSTVRAYHDVIARIFDYAEVHPNPARSRLLRLPRARRGRRIDPPGLGEFEAMCEALSERWRLAAVLLEGTGLRIHEAIGLRTDDIDDRTGTIRVAASKTAAGRRFVPLVGRVASVLPAAPERSPGAQVFPGLTQVSLWKAMKRACDEAGVRQFSPHDLRDRWISLCYLAGVPEALIVQLAGHSRSTVTRDVYMGVILDEPAERLEELSLNPPSGELR